jgi:hypothetical protein
VNVNVGEKEDRMMTTGLHSVCDIFCVACGSILGWKYVRTTVLGFTSIYIHSSILLVLDIVRACMFLLSNNCLVKLVAFDKSQRYKEGKFILER